MGLYDYGDEREEVQYKLSDGSWVSRAVMWKRAQARIALQRPNGLNGMSWIELDRAITRDLAGMETRTVKACGCVTGAACDCVMF